MTENEKILFERYNSFRMIDFDKGIDYINLLLNMYDFSNPMFKGEEYLKNNLVFVNMHPDNGGIYFSCAVSLDVDGASENRSVTGWIYEEKNRTIIEASVFRHGLNDEDTTREYSVLEMFTPNKDGQTFKRFTSYKSINGIENHLNKKYKLNSGYLEEYICEKTKVSKMM